MVILLGTCSVPRAAYTLLPSSQYPVFTDDLEFRDLKTALDISVDFLRHRPAGFKVALDSRLIPGQRLDDSAVCLQQLLSRQPSPQLLNELIQGHFDIYRLENLEQEKGRGVLVTGYYQPSFMGSLERTPPYLYPVFGVPDVLVRRSDAKGKPMIGRLEAGQFRPFWTRKEIEQGGLLQGQELVWLKDPFDVFVLHVQGSGHIRLPDGTVKALHYAQSNGRDYRSIGKVLVDTGRMRLEDISMEAIRDYLAANPHERDQILHHNESYIFFRWSRPGPAIGSLGRELTPGRSIAADQQWLPPGALVYLDSRKPVLEKGQMAGWARMQRFVTVQDTGSGLKGPGRVDVFWGAGEEAGKIAGQMKEAGNVYLLLLKEQPTEAAGAAIDCRP